jgi:hypothetical protein
LTEVKPRNWLLGRSKSSDTLTNEGSSSMRSLFGAAALAAFALSARVHAQTAITYQGELRSGGVPANGVYDFRFNLFDAVEFGTLIGPSLCFDNVSVTDGRFTLALDFGPVFTAPRFLQIQVRDGSGGTCVVILGYTVLSPRQPLSPAPSATHAGTANDAGLLGGQASTFYRNAANLTGTLSDSRLSGNVARLDTPGTFSGIPNFNGGISGATAPFSVDSNTRVANLNADLLDGADSSAFAPFSHTHDASAITSGILSDARLSASIARLTIGNTFTAEQTFSVSGQFPITVSSTSAGGTWLRINNTSVSGREWAMISTGSGNSEGVGKFLLRDAASSAVRFMVDTDGDVGIGTTSPAGRLDVTSVDPRLALRNTNDAGGTYLQQAGNALQVGMYNPGASAWGVVPANGFRAMLGIDNAGRVGSMTNTGLPPLFRNILDDGNGRSTISGGLAIDTSNQSNGAASTGLSFGFNSGEAITSGRTQFADNRFGLDLRTNSTSRLSIRNNGTIFVLDSNGAPLVEMRRTDNGSAGDGMLHIRNDLNQDVVKLWADPGSGKGRMSATGRVTVGELEIVGGADLSEPFRVTPGDVLVVPGMVMVIDDANPGFLRPCDSSYDAKVAGVISGAGGVNPGVLMSQKSTDADGSHPVALTGRVYVWADADVSPIKPGDMLTTSATPGHAQRALDKERSNGAVIGKAMSGLEKGRGLVLVLVNLQ